MESMEKFIPFHKRGELWLDIIPIPQFSDKVEILKINYDDATREVNDFFRAILHKGEISKRAYDLTTEVINVFIYNFFKILQ
jgi:hypothetical protein